MSELYREEGPEPEVSMRGYALLLGVDVDVFRAEWERQMADLPRKPFQTPPLWLLNGRLRSEQYKKATGRTDIRGALDYWRDAEG